MLDGLFRPRSIAVIGASENPFSIGHIVIKNLSEHGFRGPIFPINPKSRSIRSFKCFKSVLDVPDDIDLVNISIKNTLVPHVLKECGEKGVKFCIVHTAGFKEVGEEGIRREREMVELAHSYGMRVFGPNSQGVQNSAKEVVAYANFTFVPMNPGNISIIAQGGGMGELMKLHLYKVGLGHRLYCSYGNEADLTMPEILEYYGQDEGTKAIMMQTESFKDPKAFLEVASKITPHKPILALKAGRTAEGSLAVSSHTGTLVNQATMASVMYKKAGVVEFHDSEQMIKCAAALSMQDPPPGNRVGIITNTGGPGIQAVDMSVASGLKLATWSAEGKKRLEETQYAEASLGNPVDVVATGTEKHYFEATDTLLSEKETDMVLIYFVTAPFVDVDKVAARIAEANDKSKKPVVAVICTIAKWQRLIDKLRAAGIPTYEFAEDAARALAGMWRHTEMQQRQKADPPAFSDINKDVADSIIQNAKGKDAYLSQADAFCLLSAYGINVPKVVGVKNGDDLAGAADAVGFPCVLKVDSDAVIHKSDEGGVALGLSDLDALRAAYDKMNAAFAEKDDIKYIVQQQKAPGKEVIIGTTESPGLGSLVMFGLGGIFVEVMKDVTFGLAPLSKPEANDLIEGIKGYPILAGARGDEGVDIDALNDLLLRVSRLAADFPEIVEMDLNPIFAYPKGTQASAADVRLQAR